MSANARESSIAIAARADDVAPPPPDAPPASPSKPEPKAPAPAAASRDTESLPVAAYLLVALGTAMLIIIPRFHLAAGLIETALIFVGIGIVLLGMGLALWSYLRPFLKR